MKKDAFKVKSMVAIIYALVIVLLAMAEIGLELMLNYNIPDVWYIVPAVFRGMTSRQAVHYCLTHDWWWCLIGIEFALGLIIIPNIFYSTFCKPREIKE